MVRPAAAPSCCHAAVLPAVARLWAQPGCVPQYHACRWPAGRPGPSAWVRHGGGQATKLNCRPLRDARSPPCAARTALPQAQSHLKANHGGPQRADKRHGANLDALDGQGGVEADRWTQGNVSASEAGRMMAAARPAGDGTLEQVRAAKAAHHVPLSQLAAVSSQAAAAAMIDGTQDADEASRGVAPHMRLGGQGRGRGASR